MCGSMVDIQSPTAEIRWGKKRRRKKIEITGQKYNVCSHSSSYILRCLVKCVVLCIVVNSRGIWLPSMIWRHDVCDVLPTSITRRQLTVAMSTSLHCSLWQEWLWYWWWTATINKQRPFFQEANGWGQCCEFSSVLWDGWLTGRASDP